MHHRSAALTGRLARAAAPACQRGFSLLELLVALIVIVLVTTLVNFTVSSGGEDVRLEALVRELADVASYALDEAQMTGVDYGLLLQEESVAGQGTYSYRWLERHLEGWGDPASGKEVFVQRQLPPGFTMDLELEDAPEMEFSLDDDKNENDKAQVRDNRGDEEDKDNALHPQVIFYASGETTPGALNVRRIDSGDLLWRIQWDLLGRIDVLLRGQVEEEEEEK
ncbi:MAG TPA: prepilin-type N-terminal cleavage/methylation domain-containing protein [Halioglobus sp.]